jgi:hypothetical protein
MVRRSLGADAAAEDAAAVDPRKKVGLAKAATTTSLSKSST